MTKDEALTKLDFVEAFLLRDKRELKAKIDLAMKAGEIIALNSKHNSTRMAIDDIIAVRNYLKAKK